MWETLAADFAARIAGSTCAVVTGQGPLFPEEEEEGRGAQRLLGGLSGAKHGDIKADFLPSEKAKIEAIAKAKKVVNPAPPPHTNLQARTHTRSKLLGVAMRVY